jgi:lysophospholipase L1-like esterase
MFSSGLFKALRELILGDSAMQRMFPVLLGALIFPLALNAEVAKKDLSKGGTVLLIGDSIFDSHQGDKRLEVVLKQALDKQAPQAKWTVYNEAHGGEYIGPADGAAPGTSEPLFSSDTGGRYFKIVKKRPQADVVVINYGANDGKAYAPDLFRKRLDFLCTQLQKDYPGCLIVFSTGMYLDPKHSAGYWIDTPRVPGFKNGSSRNVYLEAYNKEARELAAARGFLVADVHRRMDEETKKGAWDFRIRAGNADPAEDAKHEGDMKWFNDVHPNDRGTALIAQVIAETLLKP